MTAHVPEDRPAPALLVPERVLQRTAEHLAARYRGVFSTETVERYVFESYTALRRARLTQHLPSPASRFAADRPTAPAQNRGAVPKDVPEVLFLCVRNAGRSQMAAALMQQHARGRVQVRSAGSLPGDAVHATVVEVMAEVGPDLGEEFPKPLTDDVVAAADVVVSTGRGDACPVHPGKRYLDWSVEDPEGRPLDVVRDIRDDLDVRVRTLLAELSTVPAP